MLEGAEELATVRLEMLSRLVDIMSFLTSPHGAAATSQFADFGLELGGNYFYSSPKSLVQMTVMKSFRVTKRQCKAKDTVSETHGKPEESTNCWQKVE